MEDVYLGVLPAAEPLHGFLARLLDLKEPVFDSYRLHPQMLLVRYQDRVSGTTVACKFFGRKLPTEGEKPDDEHFRKIMRKEESALEEMRLLGFDLPPVRVVRTLGRNEALEFLLVEEFVDGPHLDVYLRGAPQVWEQMSQFLTYHGVLAEASVLDRNFRNQVLEQQKTAGEQYPEINMAAIFQSFLTPDRRRKPTRKAIELAQLFRSLSIRRLQLFPDSLPALEALAGVPLALVSDAQRCWLEPAMKRLGLEHHFPVRVVSSDYGFRKPDSRLFEKALAELGVAPEQAVYIGDSPYRDAYGAQRAGLVGCWVRRHEPFEAADVMVSPDLTFPTLVHFVEWYHRQL
ncbi:MAG: HAD family hydrolase [Candidatus Eremiobacteraeota bacterium]|nr:HAD family hydrolase [Candidatus Eremiobacteraeota bacterium]MCW5867154.1 HAD family hydrolase [Candidatus Eremiobacteraeota bacterium]